MNRRHFLQLSSLSTLAAFSPGARAMEPFARSGPPRLRLSLAAYSFREFFKDSKDAKKAGAEGVQTKLDMAGFIDYCAAQGCEGAELTSYYFPPKVTDEQLLAIRRHAFIRGVSISGTSVGNSFALPKGPKLDEEIAGVKQWIERAAVLGAPHIRVFAGSPPKDAPLDEMTRNCIAALEECCAYAGERGIFLGLENHGGIVAEPEGLLSIVRAVKSPWLGINLDTGNFHTADPYAALAQCAPYAVNVQVKTEIRPKAEKKNVPSDLARIATILRDSGYQGWVALEYEAPEDPWKAVPVALAQLKPLLGAPGKAAAVEQWIPLFDGKTLKGWKTTDFGARGEVAVEKGSIVLGQGDPLTGITIDGEPAVRMGYEITLEAMRMDGDDFFCALTTPFGDSQFTFVVGGWGGSVVGISSIDEQDASENEATQFKKFDSNRWYRIRLRVEKDAINAWIDDEQFVKVKVDGRKISMRAGEIEASAPLGIATYRTKAGLREIRVRKL